MYGVFSKPDSEIEYWSESDCAIETETATETETESETATGTLF